MMRESARSSDRRRDAAEVARNNRREERPDGRAEPAIQVGPSPGHPEVPHLAGLVPGAATSAGLLDLQELAGNRSVNALLYRENGAPDGGRQLDARTKRELGEALGADLSAVRVHTGPPAERASESLDAVAFTADEHIYFGRGAYDPATPEGTALIAHEVVHTLQASAADPGTGTVAIDASAAREEAASQRGHAAALSVVASRMASGASASDVTSPDRAAPGTAAVSAAPAAGVAYGAPAHASAATVTASSGSGAAVMRAEELPKMNSPQQARLTRIVETLRINRMTWNQVGFKDQKALTDFLATGSVDTALDRLEDTVQRAAEVQEVSLRERSPGSVGPEERLAPESAEGAAVKEHALTSEGGRLPRAAAKGTSWEESSGGHWLGEPGESEWLSYRPDVIEATGNKGVPFRGKHADFSQWTRETVYIERITGNDDLDFAAANRALARQKGWLYHDQPNAKAADRYMVEQGLTWHHVEGAKEGKLIAVPTVIHGNTPHIGSASEARAMAAEASAVTVTTPEAATDPTAKAGSGGTSAPAVKAAPEVKADPEVKAGTEVKATQPPSGTEAPPAEAAAPAPPASSSPEASAQLEPPLAPGSGESTAALAPKPAKPQVEKTIGRRPAGASQKPQTADTTKPAEGSARFAPDAVYPVQAEPFEDQPSRAPERVRIGGGAKPGPARPESRSSGEQPVLSGRLEYGFRVPEDTGAGPKPGAGTPSPGAVTPRNPTGRPAVAPEPAKPTSTSAEPAASERPPTATEPVASPPAPTQQALDAQRQEGLDDLSQAQRGPEGAVAAVGQQIHEHNMAIIQGEELAKAAEEMARLQPEADRLTGQGYWVVKVAVFDQPTIPDIFGQAAGWTEEKDIKRFITGYLRYGATRDDAFADRGRPEGPQLGAADPVESAKPPPPLPTRKEGRTWVEALWEVVPPAAGTGNQPGPARQSAEREFTGRWTVLGSDKIESTLQVIAGHDHANVSLWWAGGEYTVSKVGWDPAARELRVQFTSTRYPGWVRYSVFRVLTPGTLIEEYESGYPAAGPMGVADQGVRLWASTTQFRPPGDPW
jgi:Domain of unknown function (DUF4157)/A nuclease of the HNH/ENDO VII superfamily with conserved WHH